MKKQSISLSCDKRTQAYTQWNQIKDNIIKKYNDQKVLKEQQYLESTVLNKIANAFNIKPSELLKEVEEYMNSNI